MNTEENRDSELYVAAMKGDWNAAQGFNNDRLRSAMTEENETALHVAAITENTQFVIKLVGCVRDPAFLETVNRTGTTALCYAATTGVVKIAKVMLDQYDPNDTGHYFLANVGTYKPLTIAAELGRREMVRYLFPKTDIGGWTQGDRIDLFTNCLRFGLFDEAEKMLEDYSDELATRVNQSGETALYVLACEPSVFVTKPGWRSLVPSFCSRGRGNKAVDIVKKLYLTTIRPDLEIDNRNDNRNEIVNAALFAAAKKGNDDFVIELIRCDPDLVWSFDRSQGTIFHIAVLNRRENIFGLLHYLGAIKDMVSDKDLSCGRNMLHLAGELAPSTQLKAVSGAALQMQRELLWFKEVEKIVHPSKREKKHSNGKTPKEIFDENHKDLLSAGEKWMKETSKSSMVVAALIATVMFTAAFTVPGGFNNTSGYPIFEKRNYFFVFAVADALSLLSSTTAILMFHSIITSRYAENDFLESLPFRMVVGVTSLFASVAAMMVAFCATFLLYFRSENVPWIVALIAPFACVPSLYVSLKYPLLVDLLRSAYHSRFMFKPRKQLFL